MKKVFVETYGCQMNVYDTELVQTILTKNGYETVKDETSADIIMLNTCSVRDNANRKIYNRVHEIRRGRENPVLVGILGCMATNFKTDLLDNKSLKIDFIAGPDSYKHLPRLIDEASGGEKTFDVTLSEFETYSDIDPTRQTGPNAWIAIMRGCNNYCTFCVVPYTRGRERSRSPENIVEEVERLVAAGYKQVTLLGQNVNSYSHEDTSFTNLMDKVSQVKGIERIFFTSPHPKDFPTDLLKLMAERDNICKQIHMPLQAGSSRILKKMNRTYTKEEFLDLVDHIRDIMPDVHLSTDIILGFPTETDEEYMETEEVVKKVKFDTAFIFKYSERPNTTAERLFKDDVSEEQKKHRIIRLNAFQRDIRLEKNREKIGKEQKILVEKIGSRRDPNEIQARNEGNTVVILPSNKDISVGDLVMVKITDATPDVLKGEFV
ncbi:tRNA (N6-isopentenyl adenosine(37)-C2)-methylthiotransferase MiaB [bacterium]|jgi:tRNA-2-methylthio-N6-dimethylallyladenosine synthase|nr:tRNA (N6-isopentenyl adenosine(37)-C2)-methylthiotransferase MiaB [bacterium]